MPEYTLRIEFDEAYAFRPDPEEYMIDGLPEWTVVEESVAYLHAIMAAAPAMSALDEILSLDGVETLSLSLDGQRVMLWMLISPDGTGYGVWPAVDAAAALNAMNRDAGCDEDAVVVYPCDPTSEGDMVVYPSRSTARICGNIGSWIVEQL